MVPRLCSSFILRTNFFIGGIHMIFNYEAIQDWIPFIVKGIGITVSLALLSAVLGIVIGIVTTFVYKSKFKGLAYFYIDIFRGTPLILQLSIIYFASVQIINDIFPESNFVISAFAASLITFSLNSGAYITEIIRAGINSVDKGEIEAAVSLGVKKSQIYKDIIFPIAFKNILPALINELITLVKETSIVSIIGLQDIMRRQQIVSSQTYLFFEPLLIVGIMYYVLVKLLSITGRKVESRLKYD